MNDNLKSKQNTDNESSLRQQIIDLQNKCQFHLSQINSLKQQNTQLRHELTIIRSLDIYVFSEYAKPFNIFMQLLLSPVPLCAKLTSEDWKQLFKLMDILYCNQIKSGLTISRWLSDEEMGLWYFCRIGIKNYNLAIFFGIAIQSLCKRKQRLKDKIQQLQNRSL